MHDDSAGGDHSVGCKGNTADNPNFNFTCIVNHMRLTHSLFDLKTGFFLCFFGEFEG